MTTKQRSSWLGKSEEQSLKDTVSQQLADSWLTVGQLSADSFHYVLGQSFGQLLANSQLGSKNVKKLCKSNEIKLNIHKSLCEHKFVQNLL